MKNIDITEQGKLYDRIDKVHRALVKEIHNHKKAKAIYRYTKDRNSEIGQAYIYSCKQIRGVHWAAKYLNILKYRGKINKEDDGFDINYLSKVVSKLNIKPELKQRIMEDFAEACNTFIND